MKSIYDKKNNVLREQPEMEKPEFKGDYFLYYEAQRKYKEHLKTLREITCSKNNWIDGQELIEGIDYVIDRNFYKCGEFFSDFVAIPIQPPQPLTTKKQGNYEYR